MSQQTITRYFSKRVKTERTETAIVKEEIELDWDEKDNSNETTLENRDENKNLKKNKNKKVVSKKSSSAKKKRITLPTGSLTKNCPKCNKVCKIQSYDYHTFYCGKDRHLQCAHCPYKTKYKRSLIFHIPRKHPEGNDTPQTEVHNKDGINRYCEKCDSIIEAQQIINCEKCFSKLLFQCSKCKKTFSERKQTSYHWVTRCGVKGYYHCGSCDYKAVYRSHILKHANRTHPNSTTNEMIQWKSVDSELSSVYQCSKCAKRVESAWNLKRHMNQCRETEKDEIAVVNESISDPNKCSKCGKKFEHVHLLNRHIQGCKTNQYATRISKDSDDEIVEVVEDHPPVTLITADKILENMRNMAMKYCQKCGEDSEFDEKYMDINRKKCDKCKTILEFKCKKCLKEFPKKKSLMQHLRFVCFPEEEFKCNKCDFTATSVSRVKEHFKAMHKPISAECTKCKKKFKHISHLKTHLMQCGKKPKFQCEHCSFKTKLKKYLRHHILRKHTEPVVIDRSQSLKIANQRFSRTLIHLKAYCSKCKNEQRLYDRLKTCIKCKNKLHFKCKTCQKKYTADDEKACDHVKAYLELIKFECKLCGRGAMSKASLSMHKSRCGKSFPCRFCKYVANIKGKTIKHEKRKHPRRK